MHKEVIEYFNNDLAATVWENKYALKDVNGNVIEEHPSDSQERLINTLWKYAKKYKYPITKNEIISLIESYQYFVFGGSNDAGIGNDTQLTSLANCFVIGNQIDSIAGIHKDNEEMAQLMKRRGGVGLDLSHLRPKGMPIANAANTSTGVVTWMDEYSSTTRRIAQDGRRGALMLTLDVRHPDVSDFINAKTDRVSITGANISVKVTEEFMQAVKTNTRYIQSFPVKTIVSENLAGILQEQGVIQYWKIESARKIWDNIIKNAHANAEPGILFWDNILQDSIRSAYGIPETATNPCGEIPLPPYDSCRLGHVVLSSFVEHPFTSDAEFNVQKFKKYIKLATIVMDLTIQIEKDKISKIIAKLHDENPIPQTEYDMWTKIYKNAVNYRDIGLGLTGISDAFAMLGIKYGESTYILEEIMKTFKDISYDTSEMLAEKLGAFPKYDSKIEEEHYIKNNIQRTPKPRRNILLNTIAPVGTKSLLVKVGEGSGVSSGIEPMFSYFYYRNMKVKETEQYDYRDDNGDYWRKYRVYHEAFVYWYMVRYSLDRNTTIIQLNEMDEGRLNTLYEASPFVAAHEIDATKRIEMQSIVQKYIDHSISSTVNLPENIPVNIVNDLYIKAYNSKLKGITVYREGSRDGILVLKKEEIIKTKIERPVSLSCNIHHILADGFIWLILIGIYEDKPYEIFALKMKDDQELAEEGGIQLPKTIIHGKLIKRDTGVYDLTTEGATIYNVGKIYKSGNEKAITIQTSRLLQMSIPIKDIVSDLEKVPSSISSIVSAIRRTLATYIPNGTIKAKCKCGGEIVYENGCSHCTSCGDSKCS